MSDLPKSAATVDLAAKLKEHFGFDTFKGNQEAIIRALLDEQDVFVLMPTGGGKSLCYQLPALLMKGTAIIISPLIALMKNQVDAMRHFSEADSVAHFLNSSLNRAAIDRVKDDVASGKTKLLYVAPESLTKDENVEFLRSVTISFYAVDEAHCISEWGHDFRPEYRRIRPIVNEIGKRPLIALTATATPKVQHDIQKNLGMLDAAVFKSSFNRVNLYYDVRRKTDSIEKDIIRFIRQNEGKSGIIYCLSRRKVEELAEFLNVNGIKALPYHAGMDSATRSQNQDLFLMEKIDVIVATIAFGMGIDKPDVRFVIHHDMPKSLEGYYQETGRAGRDGGEGRCIAFYSPKDLRKMEKFMQGKPVAEQEIGRQLLEETSSYAESRVCRRKVLLHYFGEEYDTDNCGSCDNCLNPHPPVEARQELLAVLDAVDQVKEKFKARHIIDLLRGHISSDIRSYRHDQLDIFASCSDLEERHLSAVIRQAIISGYIDRDIENYGILRLTDAGREFIAHPKSFKIVEDIDFNGEDEESFSSVKGGAGCAADPELYAILKDLRKKVASNHSLPPYVIFQDPSLEAMATTYPITIEELANIGGVGLGKARRYGQAFVDIIRQHVEDNEIERPEDMVVRNVASNSNIKIAIIQAVDRRVPLESIADSKGLDFDTLLEKLEGIVYSGTRINIKYELDERLDPDDQDELFDYFTQSESGDLDEAFDEYGDVYTEDEIRLMRIHFLSEMGN